MKTFKARIGKASGFTLVELMVVVAIIGVLSAVAIPNFRKYQAKSKTSEAKLHLASIFTAEQAFLSDFDAYGQCLSYMGYNPSNEYLQRYYTTAISGAYAATDASVVQSNGALIGAAGCNTLSATQGSSLFQGSKPLGSSAQVAWAAGTIYTSLATELGFTATAQGSIDKNFIVATNADAWIIDHRKRVQQVRVGY